MNNLLSDIIALGFTDEDDQTNRKFSRDNEDIKLNGLGVLYDIQKIYSVGKTSP